MPPLTIEQIQDLVFLDEQVRRYAQHLESELAHLGHLLAQVERDLDGATRGRVILVRQQRDLQVQHQTLSGVHLTVQQMLKPRPTVPHIPPRQAYTRG